jgi:hypothetical protein
MSILCVYKGFVMIPEQIRGRYLKIDVRNSFQFIEAFRKAGKCYAKSIK